MVAGGSDVGLVAVFDGMGGAGGTVYQTPDGPRTGAYLASRVARDVAERRMLELLNRPDPLRRRRPRRATCRGTSMKRWSPASSSWRHPRSSLRSKLLRALPTTMALSAITRGSGGQQPLDLSPVLGRGFPGLPGRPGPGPTS